MRVTAKTMDCLEFLDTLVENPLYKNNIGCIISDSPFNSLKDQGRVKIRSDDILDQETCERICLKIKALLHPEGTVYSPALSVCIQFCSKCRGLDVYKRAHK